MNEPPSLAAQRQLLLARRQRGGGVAAGLLSRRAPGAAAPLSLSQQHLWVIDRLAPGNPAYNVPVGFRLRGVLDVAALEQALNEVTARHEVWRTTFHEGGEGAEQRVHESFRMALATVSLLALDPAAREAEVMAQAAAESVRAFDLAKLPLVRATVYRLAPDEQVLLLVFHHIVGDGLSLQPIFHELDGFYRAAADGASFTPPRLAVQYADFALWQRADLAGASLVQETAFWREQLKGDLPVLELPLDAARPAEVSFSGAHVDFTLPATLVRALSAACGAAGGTFFSILLSAWLVFIRRYTGQDEVVVGVPAAHRPRPEFEPLIGTFLNLIPLRCSLSGDPGFVELIRRTTALALDCLAHKKLPFDAILNALKTRRDPGRNPIFQTLLQVLPAIEMKLGDLVVSRLDFDPPFAQVDLALHCYEHGDGSYLGRLQYATDLFGPETAARWSRNFQCLLEGIAVDPLQPISGLPLVAEAERALVLGEWNRTAASYPQEVTLTSLLEAQAARTPEAVAVEFDGQTLAYGELHRRAQRLAARLRAFGVGANVLVAISLERSLDLVIGLLAILKAGGAYVPIDPGYPAERRAFMLEDAQAPVVLTSRKLLAGLPPHGGRTICVDGEASDLPEQSAAAQAAAGDPAYMIYTSGSTGRPKGALNAHRGIVNRLLWMQERYRLGPADAVLQKTPFSFDVSVWEFFWPLLAGARLVVAQPGGHQDTAYLLRVIQEQQITVLHFVPPMLRLFLDEPGVSGCRSLRHVICSGEALPWDLQERFFARLPCELHNLYGPTEAAVDVTHWTCRRGGSSKVVPIGRPVANTQCYVLDSQLQPVPIGAPGELHLGGVQVGLGYWRRPELTAEKFIPDPFSSAPGARLYKTGDLCRFLSSGDLEYLGRLDHQVKLRGFRIELGELEAALLAFPGITQAVATVREDAPGDRRLTAYVVTLPGSPIAPPVPEAADFPLAELRAHLRSRLPEYMVPAAIVCLAALPLSLNGKVDRRALPAPHRAESAADDVPALETEVERQVASVWRELLKIERLSPDENFFELGGDSLLALRIVNRLRETFSVVLPLGAVFENPTVRSFASALDHLLIAGKCGAAVVPSPIKSLPRIQRLLPGSPGWPSPELKA